ncbi:MAG TPA: CHAT domain-containing protein [Pyrinomonadaceae bacterium]
MRTITLELLRHGPAHNQLLSPLTPYLALCENHGAVTLHVPFEHNQFLHRLSALGYQLSDESRLFQLQDTARVMSEILAMIPGLTAESSKEDHAPQPLTHLRLIISASELALLPWELALSPNGFPGAGQYLLLQPQMPICLTREIRRVEGETLRWPQEPKILFAAAAPPSVDPIPLESHLLALRRSINPWVKYYDEGDDETRRKRVEEHLHFLPEASIDAIETACATGAFTHVHILAHGVERKDNYDTRFFLALHNSLNPNETDYISGSRLATALRPSQRPDSRGLARPVVVTLASCDSANVGSVAGAGSSIAHALHESGIPMVVAGQFPLSFEGSVRLVECLYDGLLWGTDPRPLLYDVRRRLYAQFRTTHDWAALTAYVSLPSDFDQQIKGVQIRQAMRSINAAMNYADEATRRFFSKTRTKSSQTETAPTPPEDQKKLIENARAKIGDAKKKLVRLLDTIPDERAQIKGLLASTEKREAEVLYTASESSLIDEKTRKHDKSASIQLLTKAKDHYWDSFLLNRADSWTLIQYLSLRLILKHLKPTASEAAANPPAPPPNAQVNNPQPGNALLAPEKAPPEKDIDALWSLARLLSLYDLQSSNRQVAVWANGNLIELYLLSLIMEPDDDRPKKDDVRQMAMERTEALIDGAGRDSFEVYSTERQIVRYITWFPGIADIGPLVKLADEVFQRFPEEAEEKWK